MKVGLDLDDVTRNFVQTFYHFYQHTHFHRFMFNEITDYDLTKSFTKLKDRDALVKCMNHFMVHEHADMMPEMPGAVASIKRLQREGIEFSWVTASHYPDNVYRWFEKQELPTDRIYFTDNKGPMVKRLGLEVFVDDHMANLDNITREVGPQTYTVIFDRPWNRRDTREGVHYAHRRARDWNDTYNIIKERSAWSDSLRNQQTKQQ
jgi:uncharacterized HAD superfamily protein